MENDDNGKKEDLERLFNDHLHLITPIARHYKSSGLAHHELVQEGRIGLMRAVDCHDANRPFIPLANKWIFLYVRGAALRKYEEDAKYARTDQSTIDSLTDNTVKHDKTMGGVITVEAADLDVSDIFLLQKHATDLLKEILTEISGVVSSRERRLLMLRIGLDSANGNGFCSQLEAAKILGWNAKDIRERENRLFARLHANLKLHLKGIETEETRKWLQDLMENIREVDARYAWHIIKQCLLVCIPASCKNPVSWRGMRMIRTENGLST